MAESGLAQGPDFRRRRGDLAVRPGLRRLGHPGHLLRAVLGHQQDRPKKLPVDIVSAASRPSTATTAQVGPGIATRLGLQQLTYVSKIVSIDSKAREIVVHRRSEGGVQVLKTALPCLITMLEDTNHIRFGTMADAFRAARYQLTEWTAGRRRGARCQPMRPARLAPPWSRNVSPLTARTAKAASVTGDTPQTQASSLLDSLFTAHPALQEDLQSGLAANSEGASS